MDEERPNRAAAEPWQAVAEHAIAQAGELAELVDLFVAAVEDDDRKALAVLAAEARRLLDTHGEQTGDMLIEALTELDPGALDKLRGGEGEAG